MNLLFLQRAVKAFEQTELFCRVIEDVKVCEATEQMVMELACGELRAVVHDQRESLGPGPATVLCNIIG